MMLGNSIDIKLSLDNKSGMTSVHYNGYLVGGIQSVRLEVQAGAFGEEIEKFIIEMWEPREIYYDEEQLFIQQSFIAEARRAGAQVNIRSVLESPEMQAEDEPHEDSPATTSDFAKLAAACVTIAGFATLLGSSNKKQKVHTAKLKASKANQQHVLRKR